MAFKASTLFGLFLLCVPVLAQDALDLPQEGASLAAWQLGYRNLPRKSPLRPTSRIRVKIFPHRFAYPPHGKDKITDSLRLEASQACKVYKGSATQARKAGKLLRRQSRFWLKAATLRSPLFIDCPRPLKLLRAAHLPSYRYQGQFYIRVNSRGSLEVINLIDLESYLKGVVPSEVYAHWPMETLKTQAVAARTYAVYHITQARAAGWRYYDVDDTVQYQAYTGHGQGIRQTDQAVTTTRGEILTFRAGVIQTYYHADSGGKTESARDLWGLEVPYCEGVTEVYDPKEHSNAWYQVVSLNTLSRRLRYRGLIGARDKVVALSVPAIGRTPSGRVRFVTAQLKNHGHLKIRFGDFRELLGKGKLPSALFSFSKMTSHQAVIKGTGFGHGVGMSQKGAAYLAEHKKWDYQKILGFYYNNTKLCSLAKEAVQSCYRLSDEHNTPIALGEETERLFHIEDPS